MNKAELISDVAERIGDSSRKAREAVNACSTPSPTHCVAAIVRLPSFGVFVVSETKERGAQSADERGSRGAKPASARNSARARRSKSAGLIGRTPD